jgi:uncharacterized membrane protein YqiK
MKNRKSFSTSVLVWLTSLLYIGKRVSLPSMKISISTDGITSLLTKDMLRAAVDAQIEIKFIKKKQVIHEIIKKFGYEYLTDPENLQDKIKEDILMSKLKLVVFKTTFEEGKNQKQNIVLDLFKELENEKWIIIEYIDISKFSQARHDKYLV